MRLFTQEHKKYIWIAILISTSIDSLSLPGLLCVYMIGKYGIGWIVSAFCLLVSVICCAYAAHKFFARRFKMSARMFWGLTSFPSMALNIYFYYLSTLSFGEVVYPAYGFLMTPTAITGSFLFSFAYCIISAVIFLYAPSVLTYYPISTSTRKAKEKIK